jgi:Mce-associated membrane protein
MTSSQTPNPTWYDILGVAPDAAPDRIKAAWRDATDKFEPGSGTSQFRLFNEAADVLLDPERRAAYDAELAGTDAPAPETAVEPEPDVVAEPEPEVVAEPEPAPQAEVDEKDEYEPAAPVADEPRSAGLWDTLSSSLASNLRWIALVCVPLLVVSIAVGVITVFGLHLGGADIEGIRPQVQAFDAGPEAAAAAERALKPVLSYDYQHMESDRDRAAQYLTPTYRKDYLKNFNDLLITGPDGGPGPAVKTKAVVTAEVLDTGIVDAEPGRVRVIAFVNQSSVKGGGSPTVLQNRLVVTMVHRGDAWLIDKITSY